MHNLPLRISEYYHYALWSYVRMLGLWQTNPDLEAQPLPNLQRHHPILDTDEEGVSGGETA